MSGFYAAYSVFLDLKNIPVFGPFTLSSQTANITRDTSVCSLNYSSALFNYDSTIIIYVRNDQWSPENFFQNSLDASANWSSNLSSLSTKGTSNPFVLCISVGPLSTKSLQAPFKSKKTSFMLPVSSKITRQIMLIIRQFIPMIPRVRFVRNIFLKKWDRTICKNHNYPNTEGFWIRSTEILRFSSESP